MPKLKWLLLGVVAAVVLAGVAYRVFNTVATGALVYHFRMRSTARPEPVIETY